MKSADTGGSVTASFFSSYSVSNSSFISLRLFFGDLIIVFIIFVNLFRK